MKIEKFEDLECWKEAKKLINIIYEFIRKAPFSKDYRLRDQIIGASISIMNNIAEGFDCQNNKEFIRFLGYSRRSSSEVRNCLYIAYDQKYLNIKEFNFAFSQVLKVNQIIDGFLRYLRKHKNPNRFNNDINELNDINEINDHNEINEYERK